VTESRLRIAYSVATLFLSVTLMCGFAVFFVQHSIDANNRPFCALIITITQPRPQPPADPAVQPTSQYGRDLQAYTKATAEYNRNVAINLRNLSKSYNC
jgi:hypothetical protein